MKWLLTAVMLVASIVALAQAQQISAGQWIIATDRWGNFEYSTVNLTVWERRYRETGTAIA